MSRAVSCACLELRSLPPPPELPGFRGTTNLSATPKRPACPSRAFRLVLSSLLTPTLGASRVACAFLVYVLPPLHPGAAAGCRLRSSHPAVTAFPDNTLSGRPAHRPFFEVPAQRSLALRPAHSRGHLYVTCYTEGFSHFVTSMTARLLPAGAFRRVGLAPHWNAPPCHHGARKAGHRGSRRWGATGGRSTLSSCMPGGC